MPIYCDYETKEELGGTELGRVFRGQHRFIEGRSRVVKVPAEKATAASQKAFLQVCQEAARVAQIVDAATPAELGTTQLIVFIENVCLEEKAPYILMEWIDGSSLEDTITKRALPPRQVVEILTGVLDALAFAHAHGLVHGDLKPNNILLDQDGRPHLTDFGGNPLSPEFPLRNCSLPYLSPEQLEKSQSQDVVVDYRTDLFSLTIILYEMLTGQRLPRVLLPSLLPSQMNRRIPPAFDELILKGLQPDPRMRFQDARAMRHALLEAAGMVETAPGKPAGVYLAPVDLGPEKPVGEETGVPEPAPPSPVERRAGEARINEKDGAEMVWVPGGTFRMGSEEQPDERPVHEVTVKGFWIYKYPVTQGQNLRYRQAIRSPGQPLPRPPSTWLPGDEHTNKPVVGVRWEEAVAYARWAGGRLPTEAEWEWAARGPEGRRYPWGDTWDESRANTWESSAETKGMQTDVGKYPAGASWCGACDMSGNVFEWCSSLFRPYPYDPQDGREDPKAPGDRVLRGGSARTNADCARATYRCRPGPQARLTGFRLVMDEE